MSKKNTPKLRLSVIFSIALHLGVLALLAYSAFISISPVVGDNGNAVDAIMVDPKIVTEQYQRQMQQKTAVQEAEKQRQQQSEQRAKELQDKQAQEQQRIKDLEKERLAALSKRQEEAAAAQAAQEAKQQAEAAAAQAKMQLEEQQKQILLAQQKAEQEAKLRAAQALAEKQRIEKERAAAEAEKQKAVAEAQKAKVEADNLKQKAAEESNRQAAVNDILGDLTSAKPKVQQGVSSAEKDRYISLVNNAIKNKFLNANSYIGKSCSIKLTIARDGLLLSVSGTDGDPVLCREAISAAKSAVIPKPATDALYQEVKNMDIVFTPR
ncbi:cell envelope integrity protein TolA [Utexia brackfieldae]|uniref:cell envelope integrity protein TolA n=1 Tax=Utexia brackfieldae TaxID=3074108 RepID=UPI00370D72DD